MSVAERKKHSTRAEEPARPQTEPAQTPPIQIGLPGPGAVAVPADPSAVRVGAAVGPDEVSAIVGTVLPVPLEPETDDGPTAEASGVEYRRLLLPLGDPAGHGFQSDVRSVQHVDCQCQSFQQRRGLMSLRAGLDASSARLANGRRVTTYADAVRFVLEALGEPADKE